MLDYCFLELVLVGWVGQLAVDQKPTFDQLNRHVYKNEVMKLSSNAWLLCLGSLELVLVGWLVDRLSAVNQLLADFSQVDRM